MILEEFWKEIDGYEGVYEVSSFGKVRNIITGRVLKQGSTLQGYQQVSLYRGGKQKRFYVHRLVAKAFVPNPDPDKLNVVNHIDEDPGNNNVENLEWCDTSYNLNYGNAQSKKEDTMKRLRKRAIQNRWRNNNREYWTKWRLQRKAEIGEISRD